MNILALDMANLLGFVRGTPGDSGTEELGLSGLPMWERRDIFAEWLESFGVHSADGEFDIIAYEKPHMRGLAATRQAYEMLSALEEHAHNIRADLRGVHSGTLKKFATGNGKATKAEMVEAARSKWPGIFIMDDNHADALWVWEWARKQ